MPAHRFFLHTWRDSRGQMRKSDREALGAVGTVERISWQYSLYVVTYSYCYIIEGRCVFVARFGAGIVDRIVRRECMCCLVCSILAQLI